MKDPSLINNLEYCFVQINSPHQLTWSDKLLLHQFCQVWQAENDILQQNAKMIIFTAEIPNLSLSGYQLSELHCSYWDWWTICIYKTWNQ